MKVVISDTSPVRALANLGLLRLLGEIYEEVIIPSAVESELADPPAGHIAVKVADLPFVRVHPVLDDSRFRSFLVDLDPGESEAMALALELRADLILIDETAGRARAKQVGLDTIGVLGILLEAKHRGLLETLAPLLDQLQTEHRFFIGSRLRNDVLLRAGE